MNTSAVSTFIPGEHVGSINVYTRYKTSHDERLYEVETCSIEPFIAHSQQLTDRNTLMTSNQIWSPKPFRVNSFVNSIINICQTTINVFIVSFYFLTV